MTLIVRPSIQTSFEAESLSPELACKTSPLRYCLTDRDFVEREPYTAFSQKSLSARVLFDTGLQTQLLALFARFAHMHVGLRTGIGAASVKN